MFRIVTVGIEPEAMAEWRFAAELVFCHAFDESEEAPMSILELLLDFGERKTPLLFSHRCIKGMDAAMGHGVSRRFFTFENGRQVLQSFLFPRGHVRKDVSDRPIAGDAGLHQLGVRQACVGFLEVLPCLFKSGPQLPSIHGSPHGCCL